MFHNIDPKVFFIGNDNHLYFDFNRFLENINYDLLEKSDAIDFVKSTKSYPLLNFYSVRYDKEQVKDILERNGLSEKEITERLSKYDDFLRIIGSYEVEPITLEDILIEELSKLNQPNHTNHKTEPKKFQSGGKNLEGKEKEAEALKSLGNIFNLQNQERFIVYDYDEKHSDKIRLELNTESGKINLLGQEAVSYLGSLLPKETIHSPLPIELGNNPEAILSKEIQEALKNTRRGYSFIDNSNGNFELKTLDKDKDLYESLGVEENKSKEKALGFLGMITQTPYGIAKGIGEWIKELYTDEDKEKVNTTARNIDVLMAYANKDENIKSLIEKEEGNDLYEKGQVFLSKLGLNPFAEYINKYGEGMPLHTTIGEIEKIRNKDKGILTIKPLGARPELEKSFWRYIKDKAISGIASTQIALESIARDPKQILTNPITVVGLPGYFVSLFTGDEEKKNKPFYDEYLIREGTSFAHDLSTGFSSIYTDSKGNFSLTKLLGGISNISGQILSSLPFSYVGGKVLQFTGKGLRYLSNPVLNNTLVKSITNNSFAKGIGSVTQSVSNLYGNNPYAQASSMMFGQMSYMQGFNKAIEAGHSSDDAHTLASLYSLVTIGTMKLLGSDISSKLITNTNIKRQYDDLLKKMADEYISSLQSVTSIAEEKLVKSNIVSKYVNKLTDLLRSAPSSIGEGIQETSEEIGFKLSDKFFNLAIRDKDKKEIDDDINFDELASTFVLSTLGTGAMQLPGSIRNRFFNRTQRILNNTTFDDFSEMASAYIALGKKDELISTLKSLWKEGKLGSTTTNIYGDIVSKKEEKGETVNDFVYRSAISEIKAIERKLVEEQIERQKNNKDGIFYGGKNKDVKEIIDNFSSNTQLGQDIRNLRGLITKSYLDEFSLAESYALENIESNKTLARPIVKDKEGNLWVKEISREDIGKIINVDDDTDLNRSGFVKYDPAKHVFARDVIFEKGDILDDNYNKSLYSSIERSKAIRENKINSINISDKEKLLEYIRSNEFLQLQALENSIKAQVDKTFQNGEISKDELYSRINKIKQFVNNLSLHNYSNNLQEDKLETKVENKEEIKVEDLTELKDKLLSEINNRFEKLRSDVDKDIKSIPFSSKEVNREKFSNKLSDILSEYGFRYPKADVLQEKVYSVNGELKNDKFLVSSKNRKYSINIFELEDIENGINEINNHYFHFLREPIRYNDLSSKGKLLSKLQLRREFNRDILEKVVDNINTKSSILDILSNISNKGSFIIDVISNYLSKNYQQDVNDLVSFLLFLQDYAKENNVLIEKILQGYKSFLDNEYKDLEKKISDIDKIIKSDDKNNVEKLIDYLSSSYKKDDKFIDKRVVDVITSVSKLITDNINFLENQIKENGISIDLFVRDTNIYEVDKVTGNNVLSDYWKDWISNVILSELPDSVLSELSRVPDVLDKVENLSIHPIRSNTNFNLIVFFDYNGKSYNLSANISLPNQKITLGYEIFSQEGDFEISNILEKDLFDKFKIENIDEIKSNIKDLEDKIERQKELLNKLSEIKLVPNYFGKDDYLLKLIIANTLGEEKINKHKPLIEHYKTLMNNLENGAKLENKEATDILLEIDTINNMSLFIDVSQTLLTQKEKATTIDEIKYLDNLEKKTTFFKKFPNEVKELRSVISNSENNYELNRLLSNIKHLIKTSIDIRLLRIRNSYVNAINNLLSLIDELEILPEGYDIDNTKNTIETLISIQNSLSKKYSTDEMIDTINSNQSIVLTPMLLLPIDDFYNYMLSNIDNNIVPTLEQIMVLYEKFAYILLNNNLTLEKKEENGIVKYSVVPIKDNKEKLYSKLKSELNKLPDNYFINTIHAVAGVGKTTMLEIFNNMLQNANLKVVYINHSLNKKTLKGAKNIEPYNATYLSDLLETEYKDINFSEPNTIYIIDEYTLSDKSDFYNKPNILLVGDRNQFFKNKDNQEKTGIKQENIMDGLFKVSVPLRFENESIANFLENLLLNLRNNETDIKKYFNKSNKFYVDFSNENMPFVGVGFLTFEQYNTMKNSIPDIKNKQIEYLSAKNIVENVFVYQGKEFDRVVVDVKAITDILDILQTNKPVSMIINGKNKEISLEQLKSALYVALSRAKHGIIITDLQQGLANPNRTDNESIDNLIKSLASYVTQVNNPKDIVHFLPIDKNEMLNELQKEFGNIEIKRENINIIKQERENIITTKTDEKVEDDEEIKDPKKQNIFPISTINEEKEKMLSNFSNVLLNEIKNELLSRNIDLNSIKTEGNNIIYKHKDSTQSFTIINNDNVSGDLLYLKVYNELISSKKDDLQDEIDNKLSNIDVKERESIKGIVPKNVFYGSTYEGVLEYISEEKLTIDEIAYSEMMYQIKKGNNVDIVLSPIRQENTFKVFPQNLYAIKLLYKDKLIGIVRLSNNTKNKSIFNKFLDENNNVQDIDYSISMKDLFFSKFVSGENKIKTLSEYINNTGSRPYLSVNGYIYVPIFLKRKDTEKFNEIHTEAEASRLLNEKLSKGEVVLIQFKTKDIENFNEDDKEKILNSFEKIKNIYENNIDDTTQKLLLETFGAGRFSLSANDLLDAILSDSFVKEVFVNANSLLGYNIEMGYIQTIKDMILNKEKNKNYEKWYNFVRDILATYANGDIKKLNAILEKTNDVISYEDYLQKATLNILETNAGYIAKKYVKAIMDLSKDENASYSKFYGAISTINKNTHLLSKKLLDIISQLSKEQVYEAYIKNLKYINYYTETKNVSNILFQMDDKVVVSKLINLDEKLSSGVSILENFETDKPIEIKPNIIFELDNLEKVCHTKGVDTKSKTSKIETKTETKTEIKPEVKTLETDTKSFSTGKSDLPTDEIFDI